MDNYTRMKISEKLDEDAFDMGDIDFAQSFDATESDAEAFKRKYKEFYTDIKFTIKEDW